MRFNKTHQHHMSVETLEDKRLLAGDVTVSVVEGTLVVRGDDASNGVAVTSGDAPDAYIIVGLEAGDGPTSINGIFDRVEVSGVHRGVRMALGEGSDVASLFRANVRGNVEIAAGLGNDHVTIGGPMASATDVNTMIQGRLLVDLDQGQDSLRVDGSRIGHGMSAWGGPGNDLVAVAETAIHGILGIQTGAGDDHVAIGRTQAGYVRVATGAGADHLALVDSTFAAIAANMGAGDDAAVVAGVQARSAWFHGGPGSDALQFNGPSHFGRLRINGFETVGGSSQVSVVIDQTLEDNGPGA